MINKVKEFMLACNHTVYVKNRVQVKLYENLVLEELEEFNESVDTDNELKELCDVLWVLIGYGFSKGWDMEGAFNEVARSNMSKCVNGVVMKDMNGKVKKPFTYSEANVEPFLGG